MAFITENAEAVIAAWSLLLLLVGYATGYRMGKGAGGSAFDRGRLDQAPAMPLAPAPVAAAPAFRSTGPSNLSPEALARIHDALRAGNKIQAIKIMREETGLGLAEAKDAVEAM